VETSAVKKGDHWVINGLKNWITNGAISDVFTVLAVTDKEKRARGGITAFLVEKDFPGFSVGRIDEKLGQHGSITSELIFEDCIVPEENVIGEVGDGFATAMKVLDKGRIVVGALSVGAAEKLLDLCKEFSKQRVQFGKPISKLQAIRWMMADMATEIYASKMMIYNAAWMRDNNMKVTKEAAMAKLFSSEMVNRVAYKAIQIHGGMGYMRECPVERFYRDVRLWTIVEGTSEIQRLVISRELLKE
jgi:acyl-CoA dehydrogenase